MFRLCFYSNTCLYVKQCKAQILIPTNPTSFTMCKWREDVHAKPTTEIEKMPEKGNRNLTTTEINKIVKVETFNSLFFIYDVFI